MDPDKDKVAFLFGDGPAGVDLTDEQTRVELLAGELAANPGDGPDPDPMTLGLRMAVAAQIAADEPPQVWATAQRLLSTGMERRAVLRQLVLALTPAMVGALQGERPFDVDEYVDALDRLPVPGAEEVADALLTVARERQPIPTEELKQLAAQCLGVPLDDPVIATLLDEVEEQLLDGGTLAMLVPGQILHVESFTSATVATHRLTPEEHRSGVLTTAVDLAGFAHRSGLRLSGGTELVPTPDADGLPGWAGPPGWLDEYPDGALLAVRVQADGLVTIAVLDVEPVGSAELVGLVLAAYDAEVAEPWLPVFAQDLLLGVLLAGRTAFDVPQPPLSELAHAAGLERRGDEFAHEESVWRSVQSVERAQRILEQCGEGDHAAAVLHTFELLDVGLPDAASVREVLAQLHGLEELDTVCDELFGLDDDPALVEATGVLAQRLLAVASRPAELAVAHWLAALVAERSGEVLHGDEHLRAAVRADPDWPPAVDRLAWYRSDRGDAAGALELLHRSGVHAANSEDIAVLQGLAARPGAALGRNERCWCGSGRKYKACHLGKPATTASLPDRVGWLYHKATAYLQRRGGATSIEVTEYAEARAGDPYDVEAMDEAFADPLVTDVVLHEGGWFDRFRTDRGPLLPADEALLTQGWTIVARTVYEVLDARPGAGVTVRDLRTGDRLEVRERTLRPQAGMGQLVCGRAVPDGETHQFVGGLFLVAPGTKAVLLDLLDGGDGLELLSYVADLSRPGRPVSGNDDVDEQPLLARLGLA